MWMPAASSSPTARASAGTPCSSRITSSATSTTSSARKPEQKFVSKVELKPGKYTLGMEFTRAGAGPNKEALGTMKLYVNDKVVAEGP
ncbi:hypothetical protein ACVWY2_007573 [Bradyrhizobium sp. JR6.1]